MKNYVQKLIYNKSLLPLNLQYEVKHDTIKIINHIKKSGDHKHNKNKRLRKYLRILFKSYQDRINNDFTYKQIRLIGGICQNQIRLGGQTFYNFRITDADIKGSPTQKEKDDLRKILKKNQIKTDLKIKKQNLLKKKRRLNNKILPYKDSQEYKYKIISEKEYNSPEYQKLLQMEIDLGIN